MKKFGFTLAEVLITLGIIGVVAALTAPALTKNAGSAKIGPTLAKFVNTFESASETLMHDEGTSSLSETVNIENDGFALMETLMKYMVMTPYSGDLPMFKSDGTPFGTYSQDRGKYQLKDGSTVIISKSEISSFTPKMYSKKGSYKGAVALIIYDINGPKGSNKVGKEVFAFLVDDSGTLVPYGGNAYKYLASNDNAGSGASGTGGNTDNIEPDALGFYKTGEIADNGWKAE